MKTTTGATVNARMRIGYRLVGNPYPPPRMTQGEMIMEVSQWVTDIIALGLGLALVAFLLSWIYAIHRGM